MDLKINKNPSPPITDSGDQQKTTDSTPPPPWERKYTPATINLSLVNKKSLIIILAVMIFFAIIYIGIYYLINTQMDELTG